MSRFLCQKGATQKVNIFLLLYLYQVNLLWYQLLQEELSQNLVLSRSQQNSARSPRSGSYGACRPGLQKLTLPRAFFSMPKPQPLTVSRQSPRSHTCNFWLEYSQPFLPWRIRENKIIKRLLSKCYGTVPVSLVQAIGIVFKPLQICYMLPHKGCKEI